MMQSDVTDPNADWIISRDDKPRPTFPLLSEMYVEVGDKKDWDLLADLHYKMETLPVGAVYYRLVFRGETIGVCVFGMSKPLLKQRFLLYPGLKPGHDTQISNIFRFAYTNDSFRVIGRFVIDTMFRSSGVAYRFANLVARIHGFKYCEIQSSMSKYNMFAQRAGFRFVKPQRSSFYDRGLKFMRKWFSADPVDLEALMTEFAGMSQVMQKRVEQEAKLFYFGASPLEKTGSRRHYAEGVVMDWPMRRTLSKIQGLCFASPLYGIYENPDFGRDIPKRLPLIAFDWQGVNEPLKLENLNEHS